MIHVQNAVTADELDDCIDCREAQRLNGLIARLVDLIHDLASAIPHAHGLKDTLNMVSALRKELIQMKGGKPASNQKPWLGRKDRLDHRNISSAMTEGLRDAVEAVLFEKDDDKRRKMAGIFVQALTDKILEVSNEITNRGAWGVQIIKDTVVDQLGYWPEDALKAPITKDDNGQSH
jgi:hypothetical protein